MYKSPLEIISSFTNDTAYKIKTETDNLIMKAVYNVGVNVDKAELIKALEYDRDQYEKGYRDGKADAVAHAKWVKVNNPNFSPFDQSKEYILFCSRCECGHVQMYDYCPSCGARMDAEEGGADK